jgi:hypothetical protein
VARLPYLLSQDVTMHQTCSCSSRIAVLLSACYVSSCMQPEQEGTGSTQLGPEYQEWYQAHGQAWQEYYGRVSTEMAGLMAVQLSEMSCLWLIAGCQPC